MGNGEEFVAAWSMTWPGGKICGDWRWALALGRRRHINRRGLSLTLALPIALALVSAPLSALFTSSIALARVPTSPALCLPATRFTAIARLGTARPEQPFAAFEQTTPGPLLRALWTFVEMPDKMTMVHGRVANSRCSSLGAKRLTSLRGVSSRSPLPSLVRTGVLQSGQVLPARSCGCTLPIEGRSCMR
jgi:hypothetical protein